MNKLMRMASTEKQDNEAIDNMALICNIETIDYDSRTSRVSLRSANCLHHLLHFKMTIYYEVQ